MAQGGLLATGDDTLADRICANINDGLRGKQFGQLSFDVSLRQVFQRAWALAALLRSTSIALEHLFVTLINADDAQGKALAEAAGGEEPAILAGSLVRISLLDTSTDAPSARSLMATENVLRWLDEAGRIAARRGGAEVSPQDLTAVILSREASLPVRKIVKRALIAAIQVGRTQSELTRARRHLDSLGKTTGFLRTEARSALTDIQSRLKAIEKTAPVAGPVGGGSDISARLDQLVQASAVVADRLAGLQIARPPMPEPRETAIDLAPVTGGLEALKRTTSQLTQAVGNQKDALGELDRLVRSLDQRLPPPPPSPARLALAIVAVLALGIGLGLALNQIAATYGTPPQPTVSFRN